MARHMFRSPTPEGAKLDLTHEQEHKLKLVYRPDETRPGRYVCAGLWFEEDQDEYPDEYVVVPLRSVYKGLLKYKAGDKFANAIKTTKDPKPTGYTAWTAFMVDKGIDCSKCVTDGKLYNPANGSDCTGSFAGNSSKVMVGGHVLIGELNDTPEDNKTSYLLPICGYHNTKKANGATHPGCGFFMKVQADGDGIELDHFMHR